ncbi:hypothetical protein K488DRAFT_70197 [Vararia minispora EC-137]|uniref:Uncharacterized protein n=1 Tax=Vararia minispora EC-137 TaxID=1314806 RepID=A0ACB8QMX1_9AGAM|nr:hypothetical protein K488DRAFT_70197 [Vararia minispora EC-137]
MAAVVRASGTESWDDDFVFNPGTPPNAKGKRRPEVNISSPPRWPSETTDTDGTVRASPRRPSPALAAWAEAGPSTPPKRTFSQAEENWDEDFDDGSNSPTTQAGHVRKPDPLRNTPSKLQQVEPELENWDDDFEEDRTGGVTNGTGGNGDWDSSDEEDGFGDQEDRTVTARSRKTLAIKYSPPPPVPPLPASYGIPPPSFPPGSPALSNFSIPASSNPRDSISYASLSHIPLRAGSTSALAMLPPSPPVQRERRRLRKKSRPSDTTVFELLERNTDLPEIPSPPAQPPPELPPVSTPPENGQTRSTILTRVGSLKKWGGRKKRSSTSATEVMETEATPRASTSQHQSAQSSPSSRQSSGWFFRGSGGQGAEHASGSPPVADASPLKHERSITRLRAFSHALDSPTKKGKKSAAMLGKRSGARPITPTSQSQSPPTSPRRRPVSMQVSSDMQGKNIFPRQASHGTMAFGRLASSRSTFSASTDEVHLQNSGGSQEGHRSFMNGIRRISLVGKHRRQKSSSGPVGEALPAPPLPQFPAPVQINQDELLPPIELQPPSPPQQRSREPSGDTIGSAMEMEMTDDSLTTESFLLRPSFDASQSVPSLAVGSPTMATHTTPHTSPKLVAVQSSPQAASLGRSTQPPSSSSSTIVPRRNSLGDLKIPARISQAQVNLKRDLGMVREFAMSVDRLKQLHELYNGLVQEAELIIAQQAAASTRPPSRAMSPTSIFKPRSRSNTNPDQSDPRNQFGTAFYTIDSKYKMSWECAELLVELGSGAPSSTSATPPPSAVPEPRKNRERAVTLAGDESQPSPLPAGNTQLGWRASTGRNDLSARQLNLLKEMLNKDTTAAGHIPEEATMIVNRNWRWGDAMSSTVTLPSEESSAQSSGNASPTKKRRSSRIGMRGLRDMLKSIALGGSSSSRFAVSTASASVSTDSSLNVHGLPVQSTSSASSSRRANKSSTGPDSITSSHRATSPPHSQGFAHKSPRRPSIASIFRFAQKNKASPTLELSSLPSTSPSTGSGSEEDWDRIEDFDAAASALGLNKDGTATIRGRKSRSPYGQHAQAQPSTPKRAQSSRSSLSLRNTTIDSQVSLPPAPSLPIVPASALPPHTLAFTRQTRLSNVEEAAEHSGAENAHATHVAHKRLSKARKSQSPHRPPSRGTGTGSRRSLLASASVRSALPPTTRLAMTPENIRPLLESAREVHGRCTACIDEMRALLASRPVVPPSPSVS